MSTAVRSRLPRLPARELLVAAAPVAVLAVATVVLVQDAGVTIDSTRGAWRHLARGLAATVVLFGVSGHALALLLVPASLRRLRHALVLPIGAIAASLALTVLGFAHVPLTASLAVVLAAGAGASLALAVRGRRFARVRGRGREGRVDWTVAGLAAMGLLVFALAVAPSLRAGFATVPGLNPDAHLVTGIAQLFEHAPPRDTRLGLPVTHVPDVWKSKYPIFYALAGVARLSGLDPIAAFPAVAGVLCALVAMGFGLVAIGVLGLSRRWALVAAAAVALDVAVLHLALHPYWNQLWGLATFPYALLFGWLAVHDRDARALVLFVLTLVLGAFAYPLALPYPLVALGAFALAERRLPPLPRWLRSPWALAAIAAAIALAIPLLGVWEKVRDGVENLFGGGGALWTGDVRAFFEPGWFVGVGGGWLPAAGVAAFAALGLARALPRRRAAALAGFLALCALADLRLRLDSQGTYFDFKHLTFVAPLVLTVAVAGVAWLARTRRAPAISLAAAALLAYPVFAARQVRTELRGTYEQVTAHMLQLRHWSRALPPGASVRLDIPPTGFQLWAAYFMAAHPLESPSPVLNTTFPHVAAGTRADYALTVAPPLAAQLAASGQPVPRVPGRLGPVRFANPQFVLRRVLSAPGRATASRARF